MTDSNDPMRVIHNPASGETITIRTTSQETAGELLGWELRLAPRGKVPSGHSHPEQQETFHVVRGRMRFRIGARTRRAGPGDTVTVPPGTAHHFANAGSSEALVYVETRPALQMEELLRAAADLAEEQRRNRSLPRPLNLLLFMHEFRSEVQAPYLPARPIRTIVGAVARLLGVVGADTHYRRIRDRRRPRP